MSAANEKVNVRDRWKEQAGDGRGALEKLSFIDQMIESIQTLERGRARERECDRVSCQNHRKSERVDKRKWLRSYVSVQTTVRGGREVKERPLLSQGGTAAVAVQLVELRSETETEFAPQLLASNTHARTRTHEQAIPLLSFLQGIQTIDRK